MQFIVIGLIVSFIMGSQFIVDAMLNSLIPMAFYAEQYLDTAIGVGRLIDFSGLYDLFFGFGISLIVLKFLKKGFDIYVGWGDGDPDADPLSLTTNFLRALVVALTFPVLYDALVTVTSSLIDQTITIIGDITSGLSLIEQLVNFISDSVFMAVAGLILVIAYVWLWLKFMARGIEMMVMRVGMPIACVGLVDSDKGIFAPYAKKFFMNAATVLIQITLIKLSLTIMILGNPFYALAMTMMAIRTPQFLSEFMLQTGSSIGINTVYHTTRIYQTVRGLMRR